MSGYVIKCSNGDELYHHGIDGQQWGVRNGPPYPLDKSNYTWKEKRALKKARKEMRKSRRNLKKNVSLMSDEGVNKYNERLEAEKKLHRNLRYDDKVAQGEEAVGKFLSTTGGKVMSVVGTAAAVYAGSQIVGKLFKNPEMGNAIWKKFISIKK